MTTLPSGTITLLFTDIEGSSRLWDEHRSAMASALVEHNRILTETITANSGVIVKDKGDGYFAAFTSAEDAIDATIAAQRRLAATTWSDPIDTIKVRMAVHIGRLDGSGGDYHGPVVNRVARLEGVAHGGQVVISEATRALVEDTLPDGVTLKDLGPVTLRGMARPERVYQLVAADLPADFPPLRVGSVPGIPLPDFPTSFVGRDGDEVAITDLLAEPGCRLVTLLGPGGIGKTRLGVETARSLTNRYEGGAFFVDLAPVSTTPEVAVAIAAGVGAHPEGNASPIALAADRITSASLLVLDNFEHVQDASPLVAELLAATTSLDLIATSRTPLRVRGEQIYHVEPLGSNGDGSSPAVALFYERAAEHGVTLRREGSDAAAVVAICRHLDGLPLAIELVAARTRLIGVTELAPLIERSLDALGAGASDLPVRQRTIRSTIDWSLNSLTEDQRGLFSRLSVFPDGATLAQVEAVASTNGDTLGELAALVDNSLVTVVTGLPGGTRYKQLVLLREYASELLEAAGDRDTTMNRLVAHYIDIAPGLGRRLRQSEAAELELHADHNNLAAAMKWSAQNGVLVEEMLNAQCELWIYWFNGDLLSRAVQWFALVDEQVDSAKTDWLGGLFALQQGDFGTAAERFYRALERFTRDGDDFWVAMAETFAGMLTEDAAQSIGLLEHAVEYFTDPRDPVDALMPRLALSMKYAEQADRATTITMRQELLRDFATVEYPIMHAWIHANLGASLAADGQLEEAKGHMRIAFELMVTVGNQEGIANAGEITAAIAFGGPDAESGLRLLGGCATIIEKLEAGHWPEMELLLEQTVAPVRERMGEEAVADLIAAGRSMSLQDVKDLISRLLE